MSFVFLPKEGPAAEVDLNFIFEDPSTTLPEVTFDKDHPDCPFCNANDESIRIFDLAKPFEESEVVIKPALGMMIPGYFLGVTKEHITSFAQLDREQLQAVDGTLSKVEAYIGCFAVFGEYFRFEHGSDNIAECRTGACVEHAHIHLIPDGETAEVISEELDWQKLDSYEDLADLRGTPYVYMGYKDEHMVVERPSLPSQWVRRQLANTRGLEDWDWATYHGVNELMTTMINMVNAPRGRIVWDPSRDKATFEPKRKPLNL